MGRNYFIAALRSILRRKFYSIINAFGLAVAIASCLLVFLFIRDELSFDQFHVNKDRIYRMVESYFNVEKFRANAKDPYTHHSYMPPPLGERMLSELAEVEQMTRIGTGQAVMSAGDKVLSQQITYVDSGFFSMFTFPVVSGSVYRIFRNPADAVLTQSAAQKYFGDQDPVGKSFTIKSGDSLVNMTVAAVLETPPHNSSLQFQVLAPFRIQPGYASLRDSWGYANFPTFVQLVPHVDRALFKRHLDVLVAKYASESEAAWRKSEDIPSGYKVEEFGFAPLTGIHLDTGIYWMGGSNPRYSWILGGIALLILIIACINYISIALTTSAARTVEIGIRKVGGATKGQLVRQFSLESVILTFFSSLLAVLLVILFLPQFNAFTNKQIVLDAPTVALGIVALLVLSIAVGLLAGSYPAFVLSGLRPAMVLKGVFKSRFGTKIGRPLMVIQFFLSACLVICVLIMDRQMEYISEKQLGYDDNGLLAIDMFSGSQSNSQRILHLYRDALSGNAGIMEVAAASNNFGGWWPWYDFGENGQRKGAYAYRVDPDYLPTVGLQLLAGRNFDASIASDSSAIIVNESLVNSLGWDQPLGKELDWQDTDPPVLPSHVIGVVKDFYFESLESGVQPLILTTNGQDLDPLHILLVRLRPRNFQEGLAQARRAWMKLFGDRPFSYSFVDDDVAKQYDQYQRWMKITGASTVLAIVIACLGLFGLAGINAVNRTKEVGIRKVLGAELSSIFLQMNKEYVVLALIAFTFAIPVSWYGMTHWWLTDFEYHITPGWEIFAGSVAGGLLISLLTVSYHGIRAALINPAETLKYE